MRQRPKLEFANWHVVARGSRRLPLFHDDADFRTFYALLGEACRKTGMALIADCLMSNHFHLALAGGSETLTQCMRRLNRAYSGYHNERYDLSGHAFDRSYYGEPAASDFILKRVVRYIHLNPVRGNRVSKPLDYPWSSYRRLIAGGPQVLRAAETKFLALFNPDILRAQPEYEAFVEADLHRRRVIPTGRTTAWELWQEQFTWILEFLVDRSEEIEPLTPELGALFLGSRIGIPPRVMGAVLGHPDGRQVSEMLRNVHRRFENSPSLRLKLDALNIL